MSNPAIQGDVADLERQKFIQPGGPGTQVYVAVYNTALSQYIDYNGTTSAKYIGKALPGTANTSGVLSWQIQQILYDGNGNPLSFLWANGAPTFVNDWTLRASLTYS